MEAAIQTDLAATLGSILKYQFESRNKVLKDFALVVPVVSLGAATAI